RCRIAWKAPPGPSARTARATKSWDCATASIPWKGCSSIPSRSSASTATPCCRTSWTRPGARRAAALDGPRPPQQAGVMPSNLLLLRNADVHAPRALGLRHLLLGGGKVLWLGDRDADCPAVPGMDVVDLDGARLVP